MGFVLLLYNTGFRHQCKPNKVISITINISIIFWWWFRPYRVSRWSPRAWGAGWGRAAQRTVGERRGCQTPSQPDSCEWRDLIGCPTRVHLGGETWLVVPPGFIWVERPDRMFPRLRLVSLVRPDWLSHQGFMWVQRPDWLSHGWGICECRDLIGCPTRSSCECKDLIGCPMDEVYVSGETWLVVPWLRFLGIQAPDWLTHVRYVWVERPNWLLSNVAEVDAQDWCILMNILMILAHSLRHAY